MGDADGIFQIGCYYDEGIGVEKDEHKAFEYYQKSAEMGDFNGTAIVMMTELELKRMNIRHSNNTVSNASQQIGGDSNIIKNLLKWVM